MTQLLEGNFFIQRFSALVRLLVILVQNLIIFEITENFSIFSVDKLGKPSPYSEMIRSGFFAVSEQKQPVNLSVD